MWFLGLDLKLRSHKMEKLDMFFIQIYKAGRTK